MNDNCVFALKWSTVGELAICLNCQHVELDVQNSGANFCAKKGQAKTQTIITNSCQDFELAECRR